jgi:hypothetical protein
MREVFFQLSDPTFNLPPLQSSMLTKGEKENNDLTPVWPTHHSLFVKKKTDDISFFLKYQESHPKIKVDVTFGVLKSHTHISCMLKVSRRLPEGPGWAFSELGHMSSRLGESSGDSDFSARHSCVCVGVLRSNTIEAHDTLRGRHDQWIFSHKCYVISDHSKHPDIGSTAASGVGLER